MQSYFNPPSPWGEGLGAPALCPALCKDFNPPSPWGEGRASVLNGSHILDFNPPSPWGEGPRGPFCFVSFVLFQSTLPVGGGTGDGATVGAGPGISIHPPRGGRDQF